MSDQAPPSLVASTTMLAKNHLDSRSLINFLTNANSTMVVVSLSRVADMKKVRKLRIHKSLTLFSVLNLS